MKPDSEHALMRQRCNQFLREYPYEKVTPGGIIGVARLGDCDNFVHCFGKVSVGRDTTTVTRETVYDLASLTKPLVTVLSMMHLIERGALSLSDQVASILGGTSRIGGNRTDIGHLLSHSSGLAAHRNYYVDLLKVPLIMRKDRLIELIMKDEQQVYTDGCLYSDLGFILLGAVIEKVSGTSLDVFYSQEIAEPLGLATELFFVDPKRKSTLSDKSAPTEVCPWTHRLLKGEVHDDNCRIIGGVAGHAGLFGTIDGVLNCGKVIAGVWSGNRTIRVFSQKCVQTFTRRTGAGSWTLGFDTPSGERSSSGRYFSANTVGHLGFTGTSIWIDLERGITVALLTNRVHPTRNNTAIRSFRPSIHDLIMGCLIA